MTKAQLDHLFRILDPGSSPVPKRGSKSARERWRRDEVLTQGEISLGTVLRRNEYGGPDDSRR